MIKSYLKWACGYYNYQNLGIYLVASLKVKLLLVIFRSVLVKETFCFHVTSNKKVNFAISIFSVEEIYALLDDIDSNDKAMIQYSNEQLWHLICG